jgi:regulator of extracellular matrix RemA (YlzA/DUF370 family)
VIIMAIEVVHTGFDNYLVISRIVAIASTNSTSIKRTIKEAENKKLLVDMTHGRKTRAAIFTDSNYIFLTSRAPEIIVGRLQSGRGGSTLILGQDDEKGEP